MRCSFDGVIGAGSAPERKTSSSWRASASCLSASPEPIVMLAWPPAIFDRMRGACCTVSSRMMAKRFCTFEPVISSKRVAPDSVNCSETYQPPVARVPWSGVACASRTWSPVTSVFENR